MPDEKLIFDDSYVASDKETKSKATADAAAEPGNSILEIESERYAKGKPYRVILRGRLVQDRQGELDD